MKIVIPGGAGQVGGVLARQMCRDGHEVVVLSRAALTPAQSAPHMAPPWRVVAWDGEALGLWTKEFEGADAVINLAGRSVNCRYTPANRIAIIDSRIRSTAVVGQAIALAINPPRTWLQASTATIYAHRYDTPNDEATGLLGGTEPNLPKTWRFSIDVARHWERVLNEASTPNTRKVALRSAMTMSPDRGGVFDTLLGLVQKGLGGQSGNGRQYVSWIHDRDFIRAIYWLLEHEAISGPVNLSSPNPLPNAEFMQILRDSWGARFGLPATSWMLEIGALVLQTETELILKSRRVVPGRLLEAGFTFEFPTWQKASKDLCDRWYGQHATRK